MKRIISIGMAILFSGSLWAGTILNRFDPMIGKGDFSQAQKAMRIYLAEHPDMDALDRLTLEFEIQRLDRIRQDFTQTKKEVVDHIRKYIPEVTDRDLDRWEKERSLEAMVIDGKKWYFYRAAANLFRIDADAKARKAAYDAAHPSEPPVYSFDSEAAEIIAAAEATGQSLVKPRRFRMTYTLSVNADVVPPGEVVRAWLPFPREGNPRQKDVKLLWAQPGHYLIAPEESSLHRSIYFEAPAKAGQATVFQYCFEYTCYAQYVNIDPEKIQPYDTFSDLVQKYTAARPPHIQFHEAFEKISQEIVGEETNPYLKARKIFDWVDAWTPWAGAREYSTQRDIPMYCYEHKHGDCGMQTLFFMTLARMNGIPVRWQSGWWLAPGQMTLHDWCEIYFEPYGWLLVDQSFGVRSSADERVRYFCLGGTDPWRWIVNDDFSRPFYPAKVHPRSETVDFQRGEVEWRGGNLYFDQWDYDLDVDILNVE